MEGEDSYIVYRLVILLFWASFNLFFRAIQVRGSYRIPRAGPVIFVAGPHNNQFVDPMIVMINCWNLAKRRISFLIAKKSYDRPIIGRLAKMMNAIPVGRVQDSLRPCPGQIRSSVEDPLRITGEGTQFTELKVRNYICVTSSDLAEIERIESDTVLYIAKKFKSEKSLSALAKGSNFKTADRINNKSMFKSVFEHLAGGHCIGIFPEGGSHDRTDFLPMKAGVAIMALGTLAEYPDCKLQVVPVGLNYFHAHKFRSRAVVDYGRPLEPTKEQVEAYKQGGEKGREAINQFLEQIQHSLRAVTVPCPDYETLQLVQACRRLYRPTRFLPLPMVVEFTRRFVKGYEIYKDDPRVMELRDAIVAYNSRLHSLGIRDHQVPLSSPPQHIILERFLYRLTIAIVLGIFCIPGALLFSPVFVATKIISRRKAAAALKASSVKVRARDVIATWKVLVALWLTPTLYTLYSTLATMWWYYGKVGNTPWYKLAWVFCVTYGILIFVSLAAVKVGDSGVDTFKRVIPLFMALSPRYKEKIEGIRQTRKQLVYRITEIVNELGPTVFPDFEEVRDRLEKQPGASPQPAPESEKSDNEEAEYGLENAEVFSTDRFSSGTAVQSRRSPPSEHAATTTSANIHNDIHMRVRQALKEIQ